MGRLPPCHVPICRGGAPYDREQSSDLMDASWQHTSSRALHTLRQDATNGLPKRPASGPEN